jgi:chitinase
VNYAFTNIDPVNLTCLNGVVKATTSNPEDPSQGDGAGDAYADYADTNLGQSGTLAGAFYQLKQWKASHSGSKILMSIGGWTYSKYFSDVAATDASRKKFVASCIDMYITGNLPAYSGYGGAGSGAGIFDGFDIDWEWPGDANGHPGNHTSAADKANLVALLKEFRTELNAKGSGYLLTAFLPGDPVKVSEGWDLTQIFNYLDFGNAQGYDFHGVGSDDTWDPNQTGNQAQLYATSTDPHGTTDFSDQLVINTYTSQGVSPSKLTIGIPFYGRGWQGVEAGTSGNGEWATVDGIGGKHAACGQFGCDTLLSGTWSTYPPSPQTGLFNGVPGCTISHDTAAVATFCFTGAGGQWWTFDDAWSVGQKMTWVNQQGLLGVMIWEMSGDNGTLMSPIAAAIK